MNGDACPDVGITGFGERNRQARAHVVFGGGDLRWGAGRAHQLVVAQSGFHRQGLEIFRKVQQGAPDGSFPVERAKAMLEAMSPKNGPPVTPQTIAEDLGYFVEFLNKWGLKTSG